MPVASVLLFSSTRLPDRSHHLDSDNVSAASGFRESCAPTIHRKRTTDRQRRGRAVFGDARYVRSYRSADRGSTRARARVSDRAGVVDGTCQKRDGATCGVAVDCQIVVARHPTAEARRDRRTAVAYAQRAGGGVGGQYDRPRIVNPVVPSIAWRWRRRSYHPT